MEPSLMRLPRPQFTVRRLMVAVAVVLGLSRWLWNRSVAFRSIADAQNAKRMGGIPMHTENLPRLLYHIEIGNKYDRAARNPWLPVGPDPPEPK
jgi:hypothetical protein